MSGTAKIKSILSRNIRLLSIGLAVLLSLALLGTCRPKKNSEVVTIGTILPLTGDNASFGVGMKNSIELAVAKAHRDRALGKYELRLVQLDDASDPTTAVKASRLLCDDKSIVAVTAHWNSPCALATDSVFAGCGLTNLVAGAVNSRITEDRKENLGNIFRVVPHDKEQGRYAAIFAAQQMGWRKIFIIDDQTDYGRDLADIFVSEARSRGAEIIGREGIAVGTTEFRPLLDKIKGFKPDALYFGGVVAEAARLKLQMAQQGSSFPLLTGSGVVSQSFIDVAGDAAEGTYATFEGRPAEAYPGGKIFIEAYAEAKYKEPYTAYGIYAYANAEVLIEAIKRALVRDPYMRSLRSEVRDELKSGNFNTVLGPVSFGPTGQSKWVDMAVYEVRQGYWKPMFVTDESGNLLAAE